MSEEKKEKKAPPKKPIKEEIEKKGAGRTIHPKKVKK